MKLLRSGRVDSTSGFSLLEVVIASSVFLIVGYVFVVSVEMGSKSQMLVMNSAEENRSVRTASTTLVEELQISSEDNITVTQLEGGNSQVTLQVPIEVGGALTWGTEAPDISNDPKVAPEPNEDWSYRYTVMEEGESKRLVRQILDEKLVVQSQETLVAELDAENDPSFEVKKVGDMWVICVACKNQTKSATNGRTHRTQGRKSEFHVRTRN